MNDKLFGQPGDTDPENNPNVAEHPIAPESEWYKFFISKEKYAFYWIWITGFCAIAMLGCIPLMIISNHNGLIPFYASMAILDGYLSYVNVCKYKEWKKSSNNS